MIGRPGSTLWLLGAEVRLGLRDMLGRRGSRRGLIVFGVIVALSFALGVFVAGRLRNVEVPITPLSVVTRVAPFGKASSFGRRATALSNN